MSPNWSRIAIPSEPTAHLVLVKHISPKVNAAKLREFFGFCGAIEDLEVQPDVVEMDGTEEKRLQALIRFASPVASKTAIMLNEAQLDQIAVQVSYFFPEIGQSQASGVASEPSQAQSSEPMSKEASAQRLVTEWLAAGLLLTDQLIQHGRAFLEKYKITEKMEQAALLTKEKALLQLDSKYAVSQRALELNEKYNVADTVAATASMVTASATAAHAKAMQYPIVQQADSLLRHTVESVHETLKESQRVYQERKEALSPAARVSPPPPVDNPQVD